MAEGWRAFKLKVGTDPEVDVARIAPRARERPGATLRLDANQGWDCFDAVRVIRAIEDAGPGRRAGRAAGPGPRPPGLAHVRRHVETPIMADESVFDLDDLVEVVRHDAADLVNLKLAKCGGLTAGPRAGPGGAGARPRRLGRLHARVGTSAWVRPAALAVEVGCDVVPDLDGAWWLAPGAPYADRVTYVDGMVVRMGT